MTNQVTAVPFHMYSKMALFLVLSLALAQSALAQTPSQQASAPRGFVPSRITEAVDETKLSLLKGNTHPMARAKYDVGAAPADMRLDRMLLVLKRSPEQEVALRNLLDQQQDRRSPNYHRWLTPEQFGQQFGPSDQDIHATTSWLRSHGLEVANVSNGRTVIEFSGTAGQAQEAFHTAIHKFVVKGEEHWANASDPQIPAALTPVVAGVHTLHNFRRKPHVIFPNKWLKTKYTQGKHPDTTFSDGSHGLAPGDYAVIYNISPVYQAGNLGGGTIAVVARSDFLHQDVTDFGNVFQGAGTNVTTVFNGPDPGNLGGGEEVEALLDVTWSAAIAPGANVVQVVSASTDTTDGVDLSEVYIIDNNLGDVMTESFGSCEAVETSTQLAHDSALAEQAAAQGITYMVSTGDAGSAGCDDPNSETVATGPISVNALASTAFNVAVGGTQFNENGNDALYWSKTNNSTTQASALSYIPEDVWNESCTSAQCGTNANIASGGGGISAVFAKPSWQSGVTGIPSGSFRSLPDVALTAAGHDFYLLCLEGSCTPDSQGNISLAGVSGTSASAPSFAAIMDLVNTQVGSRQGQANYVLYKLAAAEQTSPGFSKCNASSTSGLPNSACIFNDATVGNNSVPGAPGYGTPSALYQTGVGYDPASGLGSVNVANLVSKWNTITFRPSQVTLALSPTTGIAHGSSVNVTVHVTPQTGGGTPTGDVSLLTNITTAFNSQGLGFFTLAAGSVAGSTTVLPGGTYNVTAHYAGDGTFAPSNSTPVAVTVTPEGSTTAVKAVTFNANNQEIPFTNGPYGSFVYIRADVAGASGQGVPTGTVDITDNGGAIPANPYKLNSQGNTATPNGLFTFVPGSHSISAAYNGDASFNASTSPAPAIFTITKATTTSSLTNVTGASGDTFTATINTNSFGNAPTGTVTYTAGSSILATVPVTGGTNTSTGAAQATAVFTTAKLTGSQSVTAAYSGDTNYTSSTSSPVSIGPDFAMGASSTTLTLSPGTSSTVTLTLTAVNGFNGTTTFSCSGLPSEATCTFNPTSVAGGGKATVTIATTAPKTGALTPLERRHNFPFWAATNGLAFAAILLVVAPKRLRWSAMLGLIALAFLLTLAGCGGSSSSSGGGTSDPGTPAGTSPVTVTGTSGSLTHSVTITLTVT